MVLAQFTFQRQWIRELIEFDTTTLEVLWAGYWWNKANNPEWENHIGCTDEQYIEAVFAEMCSRGM